MVDIRRPEEGVAGDSTPFCPPDTTLAHESALAAVSFITHTYRKGMVCAGNVPLTLRAAKFELTNE